jgi:3'(2'), 5'-bisphosphate nucleotidase
MRIAKETDAALAARIARGAGELLRSLRASGEHANHALGDAGDERANTFLLRELAEARPNDAVLSEESIDDLARLNAERVWIIDPLDGTREYREGRDDWAVHVALVEKHAVIAAAVAIPSRDEVFASNASPATTPMSAQNVFNAALIAKKKIVISRSRPPAFAQRVAHALDAETAQVGSAGAKAMMVVRGDAIAYVHEGGMNEWDAAAPVGVALAYGLHVSTLRGEAIRFNQRDVVLREGLIICAKEVAAKILAVL